MTNNPTAYIVTVTKAKLKSIWIGYGHGVAQLTKSAVGRTIEVGNRFAYNNLILECVGISNDGNLFDVILVKER